MKKLLLFLVFLPGFVFSQDKPLKDYQGIYFFDDAPFRWVKVEFVDGKLFAEAEDIGKGEVSSTNVEDEFSEPQNQALLKFLRNDSNLVTKLVINAQGMAWNGAKNNLQAYVGNYSIKDNERLKSVTIELNNGILSIITDLGNSNLSTTDQANLFLIDAVDGNVKFVLDDNGQVSGIRIEAMGDVLEGDKK